VSDNAGMLGARAMAAEGLKSVSSVKIPGNRSIFMTDKIPDDIDRTATDIVREPRHADHDPEWALYYSIAQALAAERETVRKRCPLWCRWNGVMRRYRPLGNVSRRQQLGFIASLWVAPISRFYSGIRTRSAPSRRSKPRKPQGRHTSQSASYPPSVQRYEHGKDTGRHR
jgi:hypothetical protein